MDEIDPAARGGRRRAAATVASRPTPTGSRLRDRALLELLYAAGLRVSEALGLDVEHVSRDSGCVRVIGKGDRERVVPIGDVALEWLGRYLAWPRGAWLAPRRAAGRAGQPAVRHAARGAAGPAAGVARR